MVKAGLTITAATALVAGLATATNAYGDYAPIAQDVVGVGGDTPQYDLQFIADGSSIAGTQGYNSTGNRYKLVTFNATPDGNARAAYANGSTLTSPIPLNATDVLREGTAPVQRVQSSGAAITALLADTGTPEKINFVFSASLPTAAQQTTAGTNGLGLPARRAARYGRGADRGRQHDQRAGRPVDQPTAHDLHLRRYHQVE